MCAFMVIIELIAVIFVILFIEKRKNNNSNKKIAEMKARGEFDSKNYQFFERAWQDASYDWLNERKLYPKEYWSYLERNPEALKIYKSGIVGKQEMEAGYKPVLCNPYYDKHTFDPFQSFNAYKEKIRIYNETGKFYL